MVNIKIPHLGVRKKFCKSEEISLAKNNANSNVRITRELANMPVWDTNAVDLRKTLYKEIAKLVFYVY